MHLHGVLLRSGPGYTRLLPEYLALAVVLEFAPLGAGLIVAGIPVYFAWEKRRQLSSPPDRTS